MSNGNFTWDNQRTAEQMRLARGVDLLRLKPNVGYHVVFGQSDDSRLIVAVHWIPEINKSRKCLGTDRCADCAQKRRTTFHLYCGAYVGVPVPFLAIIDLGTAAAESILRTALDVSKIYRVFRVEERGPIHCVKNEHMAVSPSGYPGWNIAADVDRIFTGRISPALKTENAPSDADSDHSTPPDSPSETKRKGRKA